MQIYVLPWLQTDEGIQLMGYTLMPRATAIARSGESSEQVRMATSYFFESNRTESLVEGEPTQIVPVEPAVMLLGDDDDLTHVSSALDGLFFATMIANTPDRYANSTNFIQFHQRIGPRDVSLHTRTLFGSTLLGTRPRHMIETRPWWCGRYHAPDEDALRLFEAIADLPEAESVLRCIRSLHEATSDQATADHDMEYAAYARALERLLHRSGHPNGWRNQNQVARDLIADALVGERMISEPPLFERRDFSFDSLAMVSAMKWIRDERNAAWHSDIVAPPNPLQNQLAVRPNLVAFRVVSSLVIAAMAQLAPSSFTRRLRSYIAASEHWVSEIETLTQTNPEHVLNRFGELQSSYYIRATMNANSPVS